MNTQTIITAVQSILQDTGTRWTTAELVEHLNDGQREIAMMRPDMFMTTASIPLVLGAKQSMPTSAQNQVEIIRNTNGGSIRQVDRNMLDAIDRNWYTKTPSLTIKQFCYDQREPDVFYVYPPAAVGASVDAVYSALPADTTLGGVINCKDICKNPLIHFVLFRAYAKDSEFADIAGLSASHYQLFKAELAQDAATSQSVQPTPTN